MTTSTSQTYVMLTEESVIQYCLRHDLIEPGEYSCTEIGDGNLNYVFRIVKEDESKGIIVKQAVPYAKVVGESWPLSITRSTIEYDALQIQKELTADLVPQVFHHNADLGLTVMEDLSHLTIARQGLIAGNHYPNLARDVGEFIAHTLFYTSDYGASPRKKKELIQTFYNPDLCDITESLVFTDPFQKSESNNIEAGIQSFVEDLWADQQLLIQVEKLKHIFLSKKEALLHGDLHTGSIFVSQEETKIIDPEFAVVGPLGFDIGQFIANLLLQAYTRENDQQVLLQQVIEVHEHFEKEFTALWKKAGLSPTLLQTLLQQMWEDCVGFIGCEMIRRTIGLALVEDVESLEESKRIQVKKKILVFGVNCINNNLNIHDLKGLLSHF